MYENAFSFHTRPFAAAPQAEAYVAVGAVKQAATTLTRGIERASGPGLLVGPTGSGKTQLCLTLGKQFETECDIVILGGTLLTSPRALLQQVLHELGKPFRDQDEGELRISIKEHLFPTKQAAQPLLLMIDEAESLSVELLAELRGVASLQRNGEAPVRLVLAGTARLEESLGLPKLDSLNQQIAGRAYLSALNRDETIQYICARLTWAGGSATLLNTAAQEAVYSASGGVPRLINQVCDHALMMAALGGQAQITEHGIEEAWADLQQMPAPWHRAEPESTGTVIEFGELSDSAPAAVIDAIEPSCAASQETHCFEIGGNSEEQTEKHNLETIADTPEEETHIEEPTGEPAANEFNPISIIETLQNQFDEVTATESTGSAPEKSKPVEAKATQTEEIQLEVPAESNIESHTIEPAIARDVFGDAFDEEEVVVDRYGAMKADHAAFEIAKNAIIVVEDTPTPTPEDSPVKLLAEELTATNDAPYDDDDPTDEILIEEDSVVQTVSATNELVVTETATSEAIISGPRLVEFDEDEVEVDEEELVINDKANDAEVGEAQPDADGQPTEDPVLPEYPEAESLIVHDDRDVIVVEDEDTAPPVHADKGNVRRREYRQLFAQLRRG